MIDDEVKKIVSDAYGRSKSILIVHQDQLELLARELMEKETLEAVQVRELLNLPAAPPPAGVNPPSIV